MLHLVEDIKVINKVKPLFNEKRFYICKTVFEGYIGSVYVDDIINPKYAVIIARKYSFISGVISDNDLKEIIDSKLYKYKIVPTDMISKQIEKIYTNTNMVKFERFSFKKDPVFNINYLNKLKKIISPIYTITKIDLKLLKIIEDEQFIDITNKDENDIGFCCLYNNEIVGVCGQWYEYQDGIEVNIKVKEKYCNQKIATSLASYMILECLNKNKHISWDAANKISVKLAIKLGFEIASSYYTYYFLDK